MIPFVSPLMMAGNFNYISVSHTWNPSDKATSITLTNGNKTATGTVSGTKSVRSTASASSGKWFWESLATVSSTEAIGMTSSVLDLEAEYVGQITGSMGYASNGNVIMNNSVVATYVTYTNGDAIGVAIDFSAGKIWFGKNGIWVGSPSAGTGGLSYSPGSTQYPGFTAFGIGDACTLRAPTIFTVPTGFSAWV